MAGKPYPPTNKKRVESSVSPHTEWCNTELSTHKKTVAPQWSTYYFINTALMLLPLPYRFCFIIASISTNSLPIFRLR